jgi:hypothetical protein
MPNPATAASPNRQPVFQFPGGPSPYSMPPVPPKSDEAFSRVLNDKALEFSGLLAVGVGPLREPPR